MTIVRLVLAEKVVMAAAVPVPASVHAVAMAVAVEMADAQKEKLCHYPSVRAILPFLLSLDEFSREFEDIAKN